MTILFDHYWLKVISWDLEIYFSRICNQTKQPHQHKNFAKDFDLIW